MNLTVEQEAVVTTLEKRFAVRAAAGSGKTSVLVDRYIRHVVELGQSPEVIVTVTFTRKAAAEMKKRIVGRLRDLGKNDDAQAAETGPIQTIHSFCERILRENAVEAGTDPEFDVLEGAKGRTLVEGAVRFALLNARDESPFASALVNRLSGRFAYRDPNAAHGRLRALVHEALDKLRSAGIDRAAFSGHYESVESTLSFWSLELLKDLSPKVDIDGLELVCERWGEALTERIKAAGERTPGWLKGHTFQNDLDSAEDTVGLARLSLAAWEWLETEMEQRQEFDFSLLESKAIRLIEESATARERIRSQCQVLLVDEAQDLNPLQYRLVDSIKAAAEMMVGDPQQSIYGFRFADRGLFMDRCSLVETFELSVNHRSEPGILRFVDEVFAPEWGDEHTAVGPVEVDDDDPFGPSDRPNCDGVELWPLEAKDTASVAQLIHQLVKEGNNPSGIAVLARSNSTVNLIAERLGQLGVPCRSVGASEKFYTRLEVRDLSNAFAALWDPYEDYAILALLHSPFVGLSVDAIVWLASQSPVVEALDRATVFETEDTERLEKFRSWFDRARSTADRVPAWETMAFLLRETPYLVETAKSANAHQTLANVRKLFAMATAEPEQNARDFANRVREVQFLRHREGDAPVLDQLAEAVSLMTIHRAKGLEFDVVVLPETHKRLTPRRNDVASDPPRGLMVTNMRRAPSVFHKWLSDQEAAKGREEELRVLYVGMTRARKRLCVVVSEEGGHESAASLVALRAGMPKAVLPGLKVRRLGEGP